MTWKPEDGDRRTTATQWQLDIMLKLTQLELEIKRLHELRTHDQQERERMHAENKKALEDNKASTNRMTTALFGNGDPAKGFIVRVDRMEQKMVLIWTAITGVYLKAFSNWFLR